MKATVEGNGFGPNFVPGKVRSDSSAASHAMSRPWGTSLTEAEVSAPAKHDAHTDGFVPSTDGKA